MLRSWLPTLLFGGLILALRWPREGRRPSGVITLTIIVVWLTWTLVDLLS
jgi:hypothetical protein